MFIYKKTHTLLISLILEQGQQYIYICKKKVAICSLWTVCPCFVYCVQYAYMSWQVGLWIRVEFTRIRPSRTTGSESCLRSDPTLENNSDPRLFGHNKIHHQVIIMDILIKYSNLINKYCKRSLISERFWFWPIPDLTIIFKPDPDPKLCLQTRTESDQHTRIRSPDTVCPRSLDTFHRISAQ